MATDSRWTHVIDFGNGRREQVDFFFDEHNGVWPAGTLRGELLRFGTPALITEKPIGFITSTGDHNNLDVPELTDVFLDWLVGEALVHRPECVGAFDTCPGTYKVKSSTSGDGIFATWVLTVTEFMRHQSGNQSDANLGPFCPECVVTMTAVPNE